MPTEPPPTSWEFPPARVAGRRDLVASGGDLAAGTLLAAYRGGLFPMPTEPGGPIAWWSPARRGIIPLERIRVSRSLGKARRRFAIRVDTAFADVVAGCADPRRTGAWIDENMAAAYRRLAALGWAHSVEAWTPAGRLAGGLYGVAIGGLFAGESMFHRDRDASKVALVALVELLRDEFAERRLLDVQWQTAHLASLGAIEVPRDRYLALLADALAVPLPAAFDRAPTVPG